MTHPDEGYPSHTEEELPEGFAVIIESLRQNPRQVVECIHRDGPAVGIYHVPNGCVVFPDSDVQPLCPMHRISDGSLDRDTPGMMIPIVDLSIGAKWSQYRGETPLFHIVGALEGELSLQSFDAES